MSQRKKIIVAVIASLAIFAIAASGIFCLSYFQTLAAADKTFGVDHIEFVAIRPSLRHVVCIYWRMEFKSPCKYIVPGGFAIWYLWPFNKVEFTK